MRHTLAAVALLGVSLWSLPAMAAKALSDDDLDRLTAAGEPIVIIAESTTSGTAEINHTDEAIFTLYLPSEAQKGLRALTVANVVGEAQLLVNLNVLSASNEIRGTDQRNFSLQSWGSTLPLISEKVNGVPGIDQSACTNNCKANGNIGVVGVPGLIQIGSASGDVLLKASGAQGATVNFSEEPIYTLNLEPNAQVDLASLFIANIVGRAQAAYNINIAAAQLNLVPTTETPFAQPVGFTTAVIKQINSGVQFRGTPCGVGNTLCSVSVTQTPN